MRDTMMEKPINNKNIKIFTYANVDKLTNASFWKDIKDFPHLCVSQTLVQGLKELYKRKSFTYINTIDAFVKEFYNEWTNAPANEIKQYLSITRELEDLKSKGELTAEQFSSFKFNQKDVWSSLRFLIELGFTSDQYDLELLSEEQRKLIDIYEHLRQTKDWSVFTELRSNSNKDNVVDIFLASVTKEIEGKKEAKLSNEVASGAEKSFSVNHPQKDLEHLIPCLGKLEVANLKGVVLHGVHQFTPLLVALIDHLEGLSLEVVFLFNYLDQYPKTYRTWKKVYEWTEKPLVMDTTPFKFTPNPLGESIGNIIEGRRSITLKSDDIECLKFDNLTTFADYVAKVFETALKKAEEKTKERKSFEDPLKTLDHASVKENGGDRAIGYMEEQFYAPNMSKPNQVLQIYYPEQFGDKPFLSYPIGQFILGLYSMWNAKEGQFLFMEEQLRECLAVNFFQRLGQPRPLEIFDKISLYFKDVQGQAFTQFTERLTYLFERSKDVQGKVEFQALKKLAFYSLDLEELKYFMEVVHDLETIAGKLFENRHGNTLNYKQHFQSLLEQLKLHAVEKDDLKLVEEINQRLNDIDDLQVEGSIEDLKETLHFYLQRKSTDNSAKWIVREFEQIDGGVLLSKRKGSNRDRGKIYHLAVLDDRQMKVPIGELLNWPLNEQFFKAYRGDKQKLQIVLTSLHEYRNFLRYSLFYATFYLENRIRLSYIENSEGDKVNPYFILDMLGLEFGDYVEPKEQEDRAYQDGFHKKRPPDLINPEEFSLVETQAYSYCKYRYFLEHLTENKTYFHNEYHARIFYWNLLYRGSRWDLEAKPVGAIQIKGTVADFDKRLQEFFPFWKEIDFIDARKRIENKLKEQQNKNGEFMPNTENGYIDLKLDFLYGKVSKLGDEKKTNLIVDLQYAYMFEDKKSSLQKSIKTFILEGKINPAAASVDHPEICGYCSQSEVCLFKYREESEEEVIVDE